MKETILEEHILERDGCPIHYWLVGDIHQPLVTFIHGAGADYHIFDPQIAAVAPFFRLLLWDIRGQGKSQPAAHQVSLVDCVEDLIALLDHLGYTQTAIVGISLGGTIAQEVVIHFPERVTSLVITGTACNTFELPPFSRLILRTFMLFVRRAPIKAIRLALSFFASVQPSARSYVYQAYLQIPEQSHRQIWEAFNEVFYRDPLPPELHVAHPLLLVRGQYDNIWNRRLMDIWAKRKPHDGYVVLPRAGHLANWDATGQFNRILLDFLQQTNKAGLLYEPIQIGGTELRR